MPSWIDSTNETGDLPALTYVLELNATPEQAAQLAALVLENPRTKHEHELERLRQR